ncbi:TPA: transketolase [Candidatus Dependentiae bacterium]|nr:MAG: hypothetical protein UR14_C0001G0121 [candidate division TM6 bacterium GW2011_GWE2_31_21]KKP53999.1 MAG: hypothetical protein UR43_C0001G0017 [candidate division TM6 bacterium GW2011_GWF2_33_332]HBS48420.1 transketolase [Candidatus Dependentiae bacterium]HBZ72906.1 transketolase [Candidatus Dependentiae bacterium]
MKNEIKKFIQSRAALLRIDSIKATTASKSGHPTTCMSAADIMAVLFFYVMKFDPKNHQNPNNDRFILSKGHAAPILYAVWKELGVISESDLLSLRKIDSVFEGHPTPRFEYNEAATGSLGQGLSIGLGMALNATISKLDYKTYVLLGDGETAEGSVWEAAELASHYNLNNLVAIVDCNRLGQSGESIDDHHTEIYARKFEAFGWSSFAIDGHNIDQILETFEKIKSIKDKPVAIIAKTFKGYGLENIQNKNGFHGKPFNDEEAKAAIQEIKNKFLKEESNFKFAPNLPNKSENILKKENIKIDLTISQYKDLFEKGKELASREAFGYALSDLGNVSQNVVTLDADVNNSTYTNFFKKNHESRFIQCFIAEQNMVSIATGLQGRGKIPFAATFGAFFSRAFDQIRMAGIGRNALRLCGSHCGVSIGEDGPSQMALEDIAMFRTIPNSIVFYPSDGVSTYKLTELMANYNDGVSYIRTTRGKTPVIYGKDEKFEIGGCKVLRQSKNDKACIIAAGITLFEALKAYEELKNKGIFVSVIDLYSVKPLDIATIIKVAKESGSKIVTVEDHYLAGGIGEAVSTSVANEKFEITNLYVDKLPRSGKPEELLQFEGIDSKSIVKLFE